MSSIPRRSELICYGYMRANCQYPIPMEIIDLLHNFYDALCFNYGSTTIYSDWLKRSNISQTDTKYDINTSSLEQGIDIEYITSAYYDESDHKVNKSWYTARIVSIDHEKDIFTVHYDCDSDSDEDEWISSESTRIAPLNTYTLDYISLPSLTTSSNTATFVSELNIILYTSLNGQYLYSFNIETLKQTELKLSIQQNMHCEMIFSSLGKSWIFSDYFCFGYGFSIDSLKQNTYIKHQNTVLPSTQGITDSFFMNKDNTKSYIVCCDNIYEFAMDFTLIDHCINTFNEEKVIKIVDTEQMLLMFLMNKEIYICEDLKKWKWNLMENTLLPYETNNVLIVSSGDLVFLFYRERGLSEIWCLDVNLKKIFRSNKCLNIYCGVQNSILCKVNGFIHYIHDNVHLKIFITDIIPVELIKNYQKLIEGLMKKHTSKEVPLEIRDLIMQFYFKQ